ncbi:MAG: hypothetical protein KIT16_18920, partial [Rhodospirillaceae bacterium]|nr:hypothetical protein [Rhodospirillaceae bacterium]
VRVLVYPDRYEAGGRCLSVFSPIGAALIGLTAGSALRLPEGSECHSRVRVAQVAFQPEAQRRVAASRPH